MLYCSKNICNVAWWYDIITNLLIYHNTLKLSAAYTFSITLTLRLYKEVLCKVWKLKKRTLPLSKIYPASRFLLYLWELESSSSSSSHKSNCKWNNVLVSDQKHTHNHTQRERERENGTSIWGHGYKTQVIILSQH